MDIGLVIAIGVGCFVVGISTGWPLNNFLRTRKKIKELVDTPEPPSDIRLNMMKSDISEIRAKMNAGHEIQSALFEHLRLEAEFGPSIVIKKKGKGK